MSREISVFSAGTSSLRWVVRDGRKTRSGGGVSQETSKWKEADPLEGNRAGGIAGLCDHGRYSCRPLTAAWSVDCGPSRWGERG